MEKLLQAFINRVDRTHLAIEGIAVMEEGRVTAEHLSLIHISEPTRPY